MADEARPGSSGIGAEDVSGSHAARSVVGPKAPDLAPIS